MTFKSYKTAVRASAVLAAIALSGGAFATEGISESFEGESFDAKLTGNGTITTATVTEPTVGYPISSTNHYKALEIAGTMTYAEDTIASPTGASQVDFMFKVEPTDELENPTGDDIRVALAVGTNAANSTTAPIKLWCKKTSGGSADWVDLAPAVTTGAWVRATLVLDYSAKKCSVSLNGNPVLNGTTNTWFYFVNNGGTYVSSITMVGSTMVDDFVVTHTALESYAVPGGSTAIADAGGVTYDYINKYGVTVEQAQSSTPLDSSGLTVAEKFVAGLDPKSGTKFELKTMNMTSATAATVTFPGFNPVGTYEVKATSDKAGNTSVGSVGEITQSGEGEKVNSVNITGLPTDGKVYFHLKATK